MYKIKIFLFISVAVIFFSASVSARVGMKESAIVVKKDYGHIVYAEDFYRLYAVPLHYSEQDLLQNINYLAMGLAAPFDFVNRALTVIKTEAEYTKYKDLLHMQFNYLIAQNYVYLGALYDKQNYYFYNSQFKDDIKESCEYAKYFYSLAETYWKEARRLASKAARNRAGIELDVLVDRAHKVANGEIDYGKTVRRRTAEINKIIAQIDK